MIGVPTARVEDYLGALNRALRDLPRDRRQEMVRDIKEHIETALAEDSSPAAVENVLSSLGSPDEIAAAAYAELPPPKANVSTRDIVTIIALLVGGVVVPVIGWIVGLVLLWTSNTWGLRDKIIGILLVPGGLLLPVLLGSFAITVTGSSSGGQCMGVGDVVRQTSQHCTGHGASHTIGNILAVTLLVISVAGPICSAVWLAITARRSAADRAAYQLV